MEPQDLNYLINKYSKNSSGRQAEEYYTNFPQKSSFSPFKESNSKAYASAMRALQERVSFLEAENRELNEDERKNSEKLTQELESVVSNDLYANHPINELKQELNQTRKEIDHLKNRLKDAEGTQVNDLQNENYQLKSELDQIMRILAEKKAQEINFMIELRKLQEEKYIVQEELAKEK